MSPTQRTLARCRAQGWHAAVVEHWNPWAKIRQDLFGVFDVLAIDPQKTGVLAIQTTTTAHVADRVRKILEAKITKPWLKAGNRIEVWGWAKRGARGKRKTWMMTRATIWNYHTERGDEVVFAVSAIEDSTAGTPC